MFTDRRVNSKVQYIYFSLEDIMLCEVSRKQTNTVYIHLYKIFTISKVMERESRMQITWAREKEKVEVLFNGYRLSDPQGEKCSGDFVHNNVDIFNTTEPYTLKMVKNIDVMSLPQ